jgi:hypothetical protein
MSIEVAAEIQLKQKYCTYGERDASIAPDRIASVVKVDLVAHENDGNVLRRLILLESQDLGVELPRCLEAGVGGDTVTQKKAVSRFHVLIPQGTKLFLA